MRELQYCNPFFQQNPINTANRLVYLFAESAGVSKSSKVYIIRNVIILKHDSVSLPFEILQWRLCFPLCDNRAFSFAAVGP
jgi:hypothetical protein